MTNKEAIKIVEDMIFNMSAEGIRISRDEDEAIEKLIETAKGYDAIVEDALNRTEFGVIKV